jgi:hypothetical protein
MSAELRHRAAKGAAGLAGVLLAVALAACGGSSATPAASTSSSTSPAGTTSTAAAPTGTPIPGLVAFHGTFQLHGAVTKQATFIGYPANTAAPHSCAGIGAKGTGAPVGLKPEFGIPTPPAGSSVYVNASIVPYTGPGTYGHAAFLSGGGASIIVGSGPGYNPLSPKATVSVTVDANGSGTFTFANATAVSPGKPTLSGTVSWTCSA